MKALFITPGVPGSANLREIAPPQGPSRLRVRLRALGICGTDHELLEGRYGWAPEGKKELILGHESLAEVIECEEAGPFKPGDHIVPIVRHPDPIPCGNCGAGEWDMCSNGLYTEHGIKALDGFAREIFDLDPAFAIRVEKSLGEDGVLLEPASVVAKAWEHIDYMGARSAYTPSLAVIAGAGPVGLLAALMAKQRKLRVYVLDRVTEGPKPAAVKNLGADYLADLSELDKLKNKIDIAIDCTGADAVVLRLMELGGPNSIICLAGVSSGGRSLRFDFGGLNRSMVLENEVVFGSVNANRRHYEKAAESLARAPAGWLAQLITRKVPINRWQEAFTGNENQIKTILIPGEA